MEQEPITNPNLALTIKELNARANIQLENGLAKHIDVYITNRRIEVWMAVIVGNNIRSNTIWETYDAV